MGEFDAVSRHRSPAREDNAGCDRKPAMHHQTRTGRTANYLLGNELGESIEVFC